MILKAVQLVCAGTEPRGAAGAAVAAAERGQEAGHAGAGRAGGGDQLQRGKQRNTEGEVWCVPYLESRGITPIPKIEIVIFLPLLSKS